MNNWNQPVATLNPPLCYDLGRLYIKSQRLIAFLYLDGHDYIIIDNELLYDLFVLLAPLSPFFFFF